MLEEELFKIGSKLKASFQVPGHKARLEDFNSLIDLTETYGTDDLHNPKGIIKEGQERLAQIYGSKESYYMVNGSTSSLHVGILSLTRPGDKIIIQRNSHMAIYQACIIGNLNPAYIWPNIIDGEVGPISFEEAKEIIKQNPDAKVLVLTHPSYKGIVSDIEPIISYAKERNIRVVIDEAHGGHLYFTDKLVKPAGRLGADLVIQSSHKTLPSLTQTSVLHNYSKEICGDRIMAYKKLLETSSPSYLFMSSIDRAVRYMDSEEGRENLDNLVEYCKDFYDFISSENHIHILDGGFLGAFGQDYTKFSISLDGISGEDLARKLFYDYGISTEYADGKNLLGVASVNNSKKDFERLKKALLEIRAKLINKENKGFNTYHYKKPVKVLSIYDAFHAGKEWSDLDEAEGRVVADFISPYPPGIAILAPGEEITRDQIGYIKKIESEGVEIYGLEEGRISVIK